MGMTDNDRKLYDVILVELKKKIRGTNLSLEERIENLEILSFFSLLCDAGEQGVTPEQREVLKMMGWNKLFAEALKGSSSTLGK